MTCEGVVSPSQSKMSASVIGRADADADVGDRGVPGVVKLERYGRWSGRTVWLVPHSAQDMRKTEHSVGCTVLYIYVLISTKRL